MNRNSNVVLKEEVAAAISEMASQQAEVIQFPGAAKAPQQKVRLRQNKKIWKGVKLPKNVNVLTDRSPVIVIRFHYQSPVTGKAKNCIEGYWSALTSDETKDAVKKATQKLAAMKDLQDRGLFRFSSFFPTSKDAKYFDEYDASGVTVGDILDYYVERGMEHVAQVTKTRSIQQLRLYVRSYWQGRSASELTIQGIKDWLFALRTKHDGVNAKTLTLGTIKLAVTPFSGAIELAIERKILEMNPFRNVNITREWPKKMHNSDYKPEPFNEEERAKIIAAAKGDYRADIALVGMWIGTRPSELFSLEPRHCKLDDATQPHIVIEQAWSGEQMGAGKTAAAQRKIPLDRPEVIEALRRAIARAARVGSKYVFCKRNGNPYRSVDGGFASVWARLLKNAGVKHRRVYQMRHTFASRIITAGGSATLTTLAKVIGHRNPKITLQCYARDVEEADGVIRFAGVDMTKLPA